MMRTNHARADRAPTSTNDVAALGKVYVLNKNGRNPSRQTKHQQELLKDYNMWGHWLGRRTGSEMCQPTTLGQKLASISPLRTNQLFQEPLFKLVLFKFPINFQTKPNPFPTNFKTCKNDPPVNVKL